MVAREPRRTGSSRSASARSRGWSDRSLCMVGGFEGVSGKGMHAQKALLYGPGRM